MAETRIALRPFREDKPDLLDDVVVTEVSMFRAEFMTRNTLWMRCYLPNDEAIDFQVTGKNLKLRATDVPVGYEDFDA